tara:strand:- start:19348 stop:20580 length:1233 start_codon:yes stop_codon:yes gene_type:complete
MFPRATTTTPVNARAHSNTIARSTSSRVARIASPARVATPSPRRRRRRDANARARGVSESEERTRIDAMGDDASVEGANDDANDAMDDIDAVEEMTRVLQTSLSPTAAAVVAKGFNDLGVENPRDLRALVAKRSLGMIFIELAATVFNALMAVSMFVITFSAARDAPAVASTTAFEYLVECAVALGAAIFSVEAMAHAIILGVYVYSTIRFETSDLRKFTKAMRKMGDVDHVVGAVPAGAAVRRASSVIRVVAALNKIRDALISEAELIAPAGKSTLHNLAAYFEYSNARSKFAFKPEDYGIDRAEAMRIAHVFSEWDADASGALSPEELRKLLGALGSDDVSDIDVNVAMRVLDENETGEINFNEFVRWFTRGVRVPDRREPASKSADEVTESALDDADPNARFDDDPR